MMGGASSISFADKDLPTLAELQTLAQKGDHAISDEFRTCIYLWRIYAKEAAGGKNSMCEEPLALPSLQRFATSECYIMVRVHTVKPLHADQQAVDDAAAELKLASENVTVDYPLLDHLVESSTQALTPRGLSCPLIFRPVFPFDLSKGDQQHRFKHEIYLWSGNSASGLVRAFALSKAVEVDKLLVSDPKTYAYLASRSDKWIASSVLARLASAFSSKIHVLHLIRKSDQHSEGPNPLDLLSSSSSSSSNSISSSSSSSANKKPKKQASTLSSSSSSSSSTPADEASSSKAAAATAAADAPFTLAMPPIKGKPKIPNLASLSNTTQHANSFGGVASSGKNSVPGLALGGNNALAKKGAGPSSFKIPSLVQSERNNNNNTDNDIEMSLPERLAKCDKECSKITDQLYLGSNTVAQNKELLKKNGVTHVLNCARVVCLDHHPNDFVYKSLYLGDGKKEDIACLFYDVLDFIDEALNSNGRVYIHCQQGVSRSSAMLICYLMWKRSAGFYDTHHFVKQIRSVSSPNPGFIAQLLKWAERLRLPPPTARLYMIVPHCQQSPILVMKNIENPSHLALDPRGAFLLHTPSQHVYIWEGAECKPCLLEGAQLYGKRLQKYEKVGEVVHLRQGSEPKEFWEHLQGSDPNHEVSAVSENDAYYSNI